MALLSFILRAPTKVFWVGVQFIYMGISYHELINATPYSIGLKYACASLHLIRVHTGVYAVERHKHHSSITFAWLPNTVSKQKAPDTIWIFFGQSHSFRAFKQIGTGIEPSPFTWLRCFWSSTKPSQNPNSLYQSPPYYKSAGLIEIPTQYKTRHWKCRVEVKICLTHYLGIIWSYYT